MRTSLRAALIAVCCAVLPLNPAAAAPPEKIGPFTDTYSFTVDCGDFTAQVEGTATFRETVYFDADGHVTRWMQFIRAPRDHWTNTTTGKTIVVRGNFQQTYTPNVETDQVTVAIRGFRYLVNEPSSGVTIQEVGRIVYDDLDEATVVMMAGQHELAHWSLIGAGVLRGPQITSAPCHSSIYLEEHHAQIDWFTARSIARSASLTSRSSRSGKSRRHLDSRRAQHDRNHPVR